MDGGEVRGNEPGGDPNLYKTVFTYDAANNLKTVTDPLANTMSNEYDPAGNLTAVIDANLHRTEYGYFEDNRLKEVVSKDFEPDLVTSYTYDDAGNLARPRPIFPKTHITNYDYDDVNRLKAVTLPEGESWSRTYDSRGNLATVVNPQGNLTPQENDGTTEFEYDEIGRLKKVEVFGGLHTRRHLRLRRQWEPQEHDRRTAEPRNL